MAAVSVGNWPLLGKEMFGGNFGSVLTWPSFLSRRTFDPFVWPFLTDREWNALTFWYLRFIFCFFTFDSGHGFVRRFKCGGVSDVPRVP